MNVFLGRTGVTLSVLAAVGGAVTLLLGLIGGRPALLRQARLYSFVLFGGAVLATVGMEHALITHDFHLAYVEQNNALGTPLLFSITGMWSALAGSILLWALILAGYTAAVAQRFRRRAEDRTVAVALLVMFLVALFFFAVMLGPANPFVTVAGRIPRNGNGPNPLLQDNILVAFHPVLLYLGFVGLTVPFSFAIASLVTGRLGEGWLLETRRWTVFAWACLTVGIILGAWWSYQVLGWGGFWAWDPVENIALLPWLCTTAYLHSVVAQERRGLLRVWNLSLLIAAFSLTILGTDLTRSGVLVSVHSFSNSNMGPELTGFFALVLVVGVGAIAWRGDSLRSEEAIGSLVSREGAFLVNNLLFGAFALVVLLGTVFPLFMEALRGQQLSIGRPYFDALTLPIGVALLFFMAVAPVLPWRTADAGLLRQRLVVPAYLAAATVVVLVVAGVRGFTPLLVFGLAAFAAGTALRQLVLGIRASHRRGEGAWRGMLGRTSGGMVVHLGVVLIALGLAASTTYGYRAAVVLRPGQSASLDGHTLQYLGASAFSTSNQVGVRAAVRVDHGGVFHPAISDFDSSSEGIGTPAIDSSVVDDVYLTISNVASNGRGPVTIDVVIQPLVMWLWVGGGVIAAGSLLAVLPNRRRTRRRSPRAPSSSGGRRGEHERHDPATATTDGATTGPLPGRAGTGQPVGAGVGTAGSASAARGVVIVPARAVGPHEPARSRLAMVLPACLCFARRPRTAR